MGATTSNLKRPTPRITEKMAATPNPTTDITVAPDPPYVNPMVCITPEDAELFSSKPMTQEEYRMLHHFMNQGCGHDCGNQDQTLHEAHMLAWRAHQLMRERLVEVKIKNEDVPITIRRLAADARFQCAFQTINAVCTTLPLTMVVNVYKDAIVHHSTLAHVPF